MLRLGDRGTISKINNSSHRPEGQNVASGDKELTYMSHTWVPYVTGSRVSSPAGPHHPCHAWGYSPLPRFSPLGLSSIGLLVWQAQTLQSSPHCTPQAGWPPALTVSSGFIISDTSMPRQARAPWNSLICSGVTFVVLAVGKSRVEWWKGWSWVKLGWEMGI